MIRTYKYRLYPSRSQETNLRRVLEACRGLYNMALAERKYAYQLEERRVNKTELYELAKRYRRLFPYANQMFSRTAQSVIEQLEQAFEAFFRSRSCSACGAMFQDFDLSIRWVICDCGLSLDRVGHTRAG